MPNSYWLELEEKAPPGWFSQYDIEVLYPAVAALESGLYLEIGVNRGRSLWVASQAAAPNVQVWGIDLGNNPRIPNTNYIQGDSREVVWDKPIDVLFIDGDHSYQGCKADIKKYSKFLRPGGLMLFHDFATSSPGVVRAVSEYVDKQSKRVSLWELPKTHLHGISKVVL